MQQCFNVLPNIYNLFPLLFHCCILLEIKLTTTATATATTATMYMIDDAGTCTLTQRLVVFHLELHLPYLTGLNWFTISHRFVQFSSLPRQMQLGNSHDLLHMLNSSCKAVSSAVAPHIHWITSCSSTSMHRPLSFGLGTTETVDRKGPK